MARTSFQAFVLIGLAALTGCSGAGLSEPASVAPSSLPQVAAAGSASKKIHAQSARAVPAVISTCPSPAAMASASATDSTGVCAHVQLSSEQYGPTTPAGLVPGYHPADLQSAYRLPSATAGANQTIGIIVAGGNPSAESDLAVYRSTFGLPACSAASGCLRLQSLDKAWAAEDANWAAEVAIDLDMASAVCPKCKLLVMQAKSAASKDLAAAAVAAVLAGATVLSNSYSIPESKDLKAMSNWLSIGVPLVAAAGDQGYTSVTNWPASATNAIAVGGTTLVQDASSRGWAETVWSGSGSGCSSLAAKPAWQTDTGCANRTVADVAAVADPATPVAVYDSYNNSGWVLMAGTSVATPIVAGVYALAGRGALNASSLYAHHAALNSVSVGSNGSCTIAYLCQAGIGYSGPAGLGSPNGVAAF